MSINKYKDEFWFSHASDAKDDPKCMLLIEQLGLEGYGIFWVLVEVLRQQKNYLYPFALLSALARKYNTTQMKKVNFLLKKIIENKNITIDIEISEAIKRLNNNLLIQDKQ